MSLFLGLLIIRTNTRLAIRSRRASLVLVLCETVSFIFVSKKKMFTVTTPSVTSPAPTVRAPTPIPERVGRAREKCKDTREEREKRGGFLDRFGEHFRFFFLRVVLKVTSMSRQNERRELIRKF